MSPLFQAVKDAQTDQNFRVLERLLPIQDQNIAKPTINGYITSAGAVAAGSGFASEKTGTGVYKITLSTALTTVGTIHLTPIGLNLQGRLEAAATQVFTVVFFTTDTITAADAAFCFSIKAT